MTTESIWLTAVAIALLPLAFVLAPLLIEVVQGRRYRRQGAAASRRTPGS